MSEGSKSKARKFLSFDGKNLLAGVGLLAIMLMTGGLVAAQSGGTPDVTLDSNGVTINTGSLNVNGNDIEDAGTTLYDASNGYIPSTIINDGSGSGLDADTLDGNSPSQIQSGTTSSDVGLGNVENIALSSATWTDMGISQSDVSASDVGLGNADNADELDLDGSESMSGNLDVGGNNINSVDVIEGYLTTNNIDFSDESFSTSDIKIRGNDQSSTGIVLSANGPIDLVADADGTGNGCVIDESSGGLDCDGTKSWVHDLGNGSEAVYTSQESPQVRAVYEGQTMVENGEVTVDLPSHFEKTVSDTKPMLRVQATPNELATVAVTERSDSSLTIEASKDVMVDYRVTGIREGYEDKQVVREKEER